MSFTIGQDDEIIPIVCSIQAHPLPLLEWSRDGVLVEGVQAPTGFMETAFSIFSVNITELGVGTHNFQCTATVDTPMTPTKSSSVNTTITIHELQNPNIVPKLLSLNLTDGNSNDTVELNCSVVASSQPFIRWLNGNSELLQVGPVLPLGGGVFFSSLTLNQGQLELGENDVICSALILTNANTSSVIALDTATIIINGMC